MTKTVLVLACSGLLALAAPAGVLADSVAYTYDVFGRVLTATYSSGVTVTYTYDAAGNRTAKTITGGSGGTNHAPVANDDNAVALWTTSSPCGKPSVTISVLANDTDADGDTLTVTGASGTSVGTVSYTSTTVTYHYTAMNICGGSGTLNLDDSDSFTYTISDGHGGTATGNVYVSIEDQ